LCLKALELLHGLSKRVAAVHLIVGLLAWFATLQQLKHVVSQVTNLELQFQRLCFFWDIDAHKKILLVLRQSFESLFTEIVIFADLLETGTHNRVHFSSITNEAKVHNWWSTLGIAISINNSIAISINDEHIKPEKVPKDLAVWS